MTTANKNVKKFILQGNMAKGITVVEPSHGWQKFNTRKAEQKQIPLQEQAIK